MRWKCADALTPPDRKGRKAGWFPPGLEPDELERHALERRGPCQCCVRHALTARAGFIRRWAPVSSVALTGDLRLADPFPLVHALSTSAVPRSTTRARRSARRP